MNLWDRVISAICWWVVGLFPGRYKVIGVDGVPYLGRLYLKHNNRLPGIYLHHFYRSDADRDLHNHPWKWSVSFILTGGYYEERADEIGRGYYSPGVETIEHEGIKTRRLNAPGINRLKGTTFHRVILQDVKHGAWTIFISGKEEKDWGFMDRFKNKFTPHKLYLNGVEFVDEAPNRKKGL